MKLPRIGRRWSVPAVLVGALLAAAVPASSAVSFLSPPQTWDVEVQSPALLQAKGAAVTVVVNVTCPGGAFATVDLTLSQRSGSTTTSASRSADVRCTGQTQQVSMSVLSPSDSRVFKKGPAFADAVLFGCAYTCGVMDTDGRTITVTR